MAKTIAVPKNASKGFILRLEQASATLPPEEHDVDCPRRYGASIDCIWPLFICVPDEWDDPELHAKENQNG